MGARWLTVVAASMAAWLLGTPHPIASRAASSALPFRFTNTAREAGLDQLTVYGGRETNTYLLETTGSGVALTDYDKDGWLDVFLVNGTTLAGFPKGEEPTAHLYRNKRDGTFDDVTERAGLQQSGWGQGACVGDYDKDDWDDLYVTYWGQNRLFRNRGDGTFEEVTERAGLKTPRRWGAGCAFLDYDRDGDLDLFAANYIAMELESTPTPSSGLCRYKGIAVACGPPGLEGGKNALYRNNGDGTFEDVSAPSGIARANGTYGLGVSTLDFNDDGWTDVYVANDSSPSALYINQRDGTFSDEGVKAGCAYSQDGKPQAGMGIAIADFDHNGTFDIFKTNFAGDTSTLYINLDGEFCEDRTYSAGIGVNTRYLGWGVAFLDLDHDGWKDLFLVNGHVYPEVAQLEAEAHYEQRKIVYRNLANGRFEDITDRLGEPVTAPRAGRGAAFGDLDNDGDIDVVVNNVHDRPDLFRLDRQTNRSSSTGDTPGHRWVLVDLVGGRGNRHAIGARVRITAAGTTQVDEVRGGGSYYAQNDFRVHFGLGSAATIERLEVRWPDGRDEVWTKLPTNQILEIKQGSGSPGA
ncbi:MAG: CRTAC1 family protein [Luteitalea sp.]|nr:CRTAC1 family protein [Luteitalea sp.]